MKSCVQRPLDGIEQLFASFHRATGDLVVVGVARVAALSRITAVDQTLQTAIEQLYLDNENTPELGNLFACPQLNTRYNQDWNSAQWWTEIQRLSTDLKQRLVLKEYLWILDTSAHQMKSSVAQLFQRCSKEAYHGRDYPSRVSNLGQIDLKTDDPLWDAEEVYFSSGHGKMGTYLFISVVTAADGMGLCLDYPEPICSTSQAEIFFENFCCFLTEMTQK